MLEVSHFCLDNTIRLCSNDAERSTCKGSVVSVSTLLSTCLRLASSQSSSASAEKGVSPVQRRSNGKTGRRRPVVSSAGSSLLLNREPTCLPPASFQSPIQEVHPADSIYKADSASIKTIAESIEIDLGSNEAVSSAELYALELDYQQDHFELVQRDRQRERHSTNQLIDTAAAYYARLKKRPAVDMQANTEDTLSNKRLKLMERDDASSTTPEETTQQTKVSAPRSRKSSKTAAPRASKTDSKPRGKKTASSTVAKTRIPAPNDENVAPTANVSAPQAKQTEQETAHALPMKQGATTGSDDKRFEPRSTKESLHSGAGVEEIRDIAIVPVKVYKQTESQTTVTTLIERSVETLKEDAKMFDDQGCQSEDSGASAQPNKYQIYEFDGAPSQRLPKRSVLDVTSTIQPKPCQRYYADAYVSCGEAIRQDVATGTESSKSIDESTMTELDVTEATSNDDRLDDMLCTQCRVKKHAPIGACITNPDEAEAVDALSSLLHLKVSGMPMFKGVEKEEAQEGIGHFYCTAKAAIANADAQNNSIISEEEVSKSLIPCEEDDKAVSRTNYTGRETSTNVELCSSAVKQETPEASSPVLPLKKAQGRQKKTPEQKEEQARLREALKEYKLLRRTCRSTQQVDYKETGRTTSRDKHEEKAQNQEAFEDSSSRTRKRTVDEGVILQEDITKTMHPKQKRKKNKG